MIDISFFNSDLCKAARILLKINQKELATQSFVSLSSIARFESLKSCLNYSNTIKIIKFYEVNGVEFLNNENSIGVVLYRNNIKS